MKFITNEDCFPNELSQFIYTSSLLEQNVVQVVAPLLDTGLLPCEKTDDIYALLEMLYGESNQLASAKHKLDCLRQADQVTLAWDAHF